MDDQRATCIRTQPLQPDQLAGSRKENQTGGRRTRLPAFIRLPELEYRTAKLQRAGGRERTQDPHGETLSTETKTKIRCS